MSTINSATRYAVDKDVGLSGEQVEERVQNGLVNKESAIRTKSISDIVKNNLCTLFNLINFILAAALIYVGSYKNLLFIGVVISNIIIGTFQEIRAKKTVDKLSILTKNKINVLRSSKIEQVEIDDLLLDDIMILDSGTQVPTDSVVVDGFCEVNESLLTGEADAVHKHVGDMILSGSFLVSGKCKARVEHISDDNYAFKISQDAKYLKKVNSEIMSALKKIILILSILIIPIGIFLFYKQVNNSSCLKDAVEGTTAALIGMIPEGLVLLTSTVLAVGILRLSRHKVLVQELYCIETLARVDTLCLDKTGTLTEGVMEVNNIVPGGAHDSRDVWRALTLAVGASVDDNPTINAVREAMPKDIDIGESVAADKVVPFSSEKKWSGVYYKKYGSFVLGAPEFVFRRQYSQIKAQVDEFSKENRVVVIAHSKRAFREDDLPEDLEPVGFVLLRDKIRPEAKKTLEYFNAQGVEIKVISGDNVQTVVNVAKRAGVKNYEKCIDLSEVETDEELRAAAENYYVFGRVSPLQKKKLIGFLKANGHIVSMTGDGVNDVLALKESDCGIAMASGSAAAKNVSQLILLNSNFDAMPKVVAEGRRAINNIQRSSSLFLVKTVYSTLLAIIFLFLNRAYPFMPIQMTLTSVLTIGIPSFILALEPNRERIRGRFFVNILSKAVPCAVTIVCSILLIMGAATLFHFSEDQISTLCVVSVGCCGFLLLFQISKPFNLVRKTLFATMCTLFVLGITIFSRLFSLLPPAFYLIFLFACVFVLDFFLFRILLSSLKKFALFLLKKYKKLLIKLLH